MSGLNYMQSDLIYRQAALDVLKLNWAGKAAIDAIKDLPSALPGRKTGKWNRLSDDTFHCLECGATFIVAQGKDHMRFCPSCGTDTREPMIISSFPRRGETGNDRV